MESNDSNLKFQTQRHSMVGIRDETHIYMNSTDQVVTFQTKSKAPSKDGSQTASILGSTLNEFDKKLNTTIQNVLQGPHNMPQAPKDILETSQDEEPAKSKRAEKKKESNKIKVEQFAEQEKTPNKEMQNQFNNSKYFRMISNKSGTDLKRGLMLGS